MQYFIHLRQNSDKLQLYVNAVFSIFSASFFFIDRLIRFMCILSYLALFFFLFSVYIIQTHSFPSELLINLFYQMYILHNKKHGNCVKFMYITTCKSTVTVLQYSHSKGQRQKRKSSQKSLDLDIVKDINIL